MWKFVLAAAIPAAAHFRYRNLDNDVTDIEDDELLEYSVTDEVLLWKIPAQQKVSVQ